MNGPQPHKAGALADTLFQLQADLDFTKHLGGQTATDRLVELCQIDRADCVLDVGCGGESLTAIPQKPAVAASSGST